MRRSRAKFTHQVVLLMAMILPLAAAAQTPAPNQPGSASIPRKLTLAQAEQLLLQRNLAVLAAKYQVDAFRAAKLIAGFKPNPILTLGAEEFNLSGKFFKNIARTDPETANDEALEIDFKLDDRPINQTLAELRKIALAERPDVIAARRLYDGASKGVALARAQRARDVLVGVFYQHIGSDNTAGVNVSFPLFMYNKGFAAISQAEAQKEAGAALARQAELQAVTDVEKAYLAYQSARQTLDIYNSSTLGRAGRLKTVAAFSYKEGATSLLDLLDAQRSYNQTISSYNQARADYQMALWQLEQAVDRPLR